MINFKWGYGVVVSLAVGLTGCQMDSMGSERAEHAVQNTVAYDHSQQAKTTAETVKSSYSSKDPVQKSTPGPKRAAAPQIPVIQ